MTTCQNGKNGALHEYMGMHNALVEKVSGDPTYCSKLESASKAAGLEDINVAKYDTIIGKGARYEEESIDVFTSWLPRITKYAEDM